MIQLNGEKINVKLGFTEILMGTETLNMAGKWIMLTLMEAIIFQT